jgi:DNA helicase-2/ATP-dependent DNA helicase PcrA
MVRGVGGTVAANDIAVPVNHYPSSFSREDRLVTSFSDLRYYLECPHDFYLRVVLGFTPTIGQEFGYGRGVHNLLRAVHSDPRWWADLDADPEKLEAEIRRMVDRGMFYLRYTTGDPLVNLQGKAIEGVADYVRHYAGELARLEFEPEREFETVIPGENLLIAGAIDVVRLDDPPRVTILDFKSGDAEEETGSGLTRELMGMQIGVYGLAARHELEYDPQHGVVRYIGEQDPLRRELLVDLSERQLADVRERLAETGRRIRQRRFHEGPSGLIPHRCERCDFLNICRRPEANLERNRRRH